MKKIFSRPSTWIVLVFLVALLTRFYGLIKYPVSFSMDEVAIGTNAYSILKTGMDEHGVRYPLAFRSVGDFKPPVNIYLTALSEAVFGLTEIAVRFPVALIGSLTVIVFIFFLKSLQFSWKAAVFGGLWLAVLPWHIHFSRGSFEAITALFFLIAGAWLFVSWVSSKKLLKLILSIISFSLSVWAYHAERFFVPILVIFLIINYRNEIKLRSKKIRSQLILGIFVLLVFAVPFIKLAIFTPAIAQRAAVTSILREQSLLQSLHKGNYSDLTQKIFDNDSYLVFRHWAGKYLNYYDFRFWFWKGMQFTPPGYPDLGILYAVDLPIILYGFYSLTVSKNKNLKNVAIFWFFAGPLSASFTMNEQHPLRALTWIPFFGIVVASGFERLTGAVKKRWAYPVYGILVAANLVYFGDIYMHQFPRFYAESWQYGYKQAASFACRNIENYDKILISDTFGSLGPLNTGTPYLYMLFYCPQNMNYSLSDGKQLPEIYFRRPNKDVINEKGRLLLIGSPWDFLDGDLYGGKIIERITYPSGIDAFLLVERK
jgi:4-amino-4-deoxy-L-arabinose transferase-like glycosyltransferase